MVPGCYEQAGTTSLGETTTRPVACCLVYLLLNQIYIQTEELGILITPLRM